MQSALKNFITEDEFVRLMKPFTLYLNNNKISVSVSGGPDSIVLLFLLSNWALSESLILYAFTVNHKLREESEDEAKFVASYCESIKVKHKVLNWENDNPKSGIQEKARLARYSLLSKECRNNGINLLLTAHHADDVAETFAYRLLSGSNLDGLAPIKTIRTLNSIYLGRPFLRLSKEKILNTIKVKKLKYIVDPTNYNTEFTRIKMRNILNIEPKLKNDFIKTSQVFQKLKDIIYHNMIDSFKNSVKIFPEGYISVKKSLFLSLPNFICIKFLSYNLQKIGNKKYPPRSKSLKYLLLNIKTKNIKRLTVSGCIISIKKNELTIMREYFRIKDSSILLSPKSSELWDKRFRVYNKSSNSYYLVDSLGIEGWKKIKLVVKKDFDTKSGVVRIFWQQISRIVAFS